MGLGLAPSLLAADCPDECDDADQQPPTATHHHLHSDPHTPGSTTMKIAASFTFLALLGAAAAQKPAAASNNLRGKRECTACKCAGGWDGGGAIDRANRSV